MTGKNPPGRPHQAARPADDSKTRAASGLGAAARNSLPRAVRVAFYGRTPCAAGTCDSRADRYRQLALCHAVAAARGWQVTAEFFDEDCRADYPWRRRPQRRALLAALSGRGPRRRSSSSRGPLVPASRRPLPGGTPILARLVFRRVLLVLAGTGMAIRSAEEYALLGRLLTGSPCGAPPGGTASRLSVRDYRARGGQPRRPCHPGEPR